MEAGGKVGAYRVVRLLGRGGMSEVYEVEHEALRKRLAMKVFNADGEFADQLRTRVLTKSALSEQSREVYRLAREGVSNGAIAKCLGMTAAAVRMARSRVDALVAAVEESLFR